MELVPLATARAAELFDSGADAAEALPKALDQAIQVHGGAVGTRFPAYATSMGRVLLANLPSRKLEH